MFLLRERLKLEERPGVSRGDPSSPRGALE